MWALGYSSKAWLERFHFRDSLTLYTLKASRFTKNKDFHWFECSKPLQGFFLNAWNVSWWYLSETRMKKVVIKDVIWWGLYIWVKFCNFFVIRLLLEASEISILFMKLIYLKWFSSGVSLNIRVAYSLTFNSPGSRKFGNNHVWSKFSNKIVPRRYIFWILLTRIQLLFVLV